MDRLSRYRRSYAEELKYVAALRSPAVVKAFARVPRERFLGLGPWQILAPDLSSYWPTPDDDPRHLYHNILIAIDPSRGLNNGQPSFLAALIDAVAPSRGERVLHVGAGTGYYSAVLGTLVGRRGRVDAIEVDAGLAERAAANLKGWPQVRLIHGDGATAFAGPYDVMLINAGATHPVDGWLAAMAPNGRLLLPLTNGERSGAVFRIARLATGFACRMVTPVGIFACAGARGEPQEALLAEALAAGGQREVRSLRREPHPPEAECWLHGEGYCLSRRAPA